MCYLEETVLSEQGSETTRGSYQKQTYKFAEMINPERKRQKPISNGNWSLECGGKCTQTSACNHSYKSIHGEIKKKKTNKEFICSPSYLSSTPITIHIY